MARRRQHLVSRHQAFRKNYLIRSAQTAQRGPEARDERIRTDESSEYGKMNNPDTPPRTTAGGNDRRDPKPDRRRQRVQPEGLNRRQEATAGGLRERRCETELIGPPQNTEQTRRPKRQTWQSAPERPRGRRIKQPRQNGSDHDGPEDNSTRTEPLGTRADPLASRRHYQQ